MKPHHSNLCTVVEQALPQALTGQKILVLGEEGKPSARLLSPSHYDPAQTGRPAPALVVFTSGTTGKPKGVALSARALVRAAEATHSFLSQSSFSPHSACNTQLTSRWYLALPPYHIGGAQVLVRSYTAGAAPIISTHLREERSFSAGTFAVDIHHWEKTRTPGEHLYISLVPTQLQRILTDPEATRAAALASTILIGGSAVAPSLLARAHQAGLRIVRTYGMSETVGGCVYDGIPLPGMELGLTEDDRVYFTGDLLADGYVDFRSPDQLIACQSLPMQNPPAHASSGFYTDGSFLSNDLGSITDGVLQIHGRADDVINTGGEKVSPLRVEHILADSVPTYGFSEVVVTSIPDEEWGERVVCLLTTESHQPSKPVTNAVPLPPSVVSALRTRLRTVLREAERPTDFAVIPSIPVNHMGKPDRKALRKIAAECFSHQVKGRE